MFHRLNFSKSILNIRIGKGTNGEASYYVEHNLMEEFYRITKKATNFVFLVASPMMVYFIIFAKEGIFFLSGSAYAGSIVPMQIIMPTLLLIADAVKAADKKDPGAVKSSVAYQALQKITRGARYYGGKQA